MGATRIQFPTHVAPPQSRRKSVKDLRIASGLDAADYKRLVTAADAERSSISDYIRRIVVKHLDQLQ